MQFRRITSSGRYIPEIDGLRFLAIILVVLFHLYASINIKTGFNSSQSTIVHLPLVNGHQGVELFFVISGFILALPLLNNKKEINIKKYFYRRLTRLEPPYIISMVGFYILLKYLLIAPVPFGNFISSLFYLHNIIYNKPSLINTVAWSLEIEVQFYILAPIIGFFIRKLNDLYRIIALICGIIIFSVIPYYGYLNNHLTIASYLHFFLAGFLMAQLHISKIQLIKNEILQIMIGLVLLITLLYLNSEANIIISILFPYLIFLFYHLVLINKQWSYVFSRKWITIIGGMCYSIYLLHFPIIGFFGDLLLSHGIIISSVMSAIAFSLILLVIILFISTAFYLLIERPCMYPDWPQKVIQYFNYKYYKWLNQK